LTSRCSNHLALRDVLRADKALRDEYAALKKLVQSPGHEH